MLGRNIINNVIIEIIVELNGKKSEYLFTLKSNKETTIGKELKDFLRLKNYKVNSTYHIYLFREQKIIKELEQK